MAYRAVMKASVLAATLVMGLTGPARADDPMRVQMLSMMVPVVDPAGKAAGNTPLTIILEAAERKGALDACKQSIYLRDAMLESLYKDPLRKKPTGEVDTEGGRQRVVDVANRLLGGKVISNAYLVDASRSMGGGAGARLPFTSVLGCKDLDGKGKKSKDGEGKDGHDGKDGEKKASKGH